MNNCPLCDTEDIIVNDVELLGNGILHRFNNSAGIPYSSIFSDGMEFFSCERSKEQEIIDLWNDLESKKKKYQRYKQLDNVMMIEFTDPYLGEMVALFNIEKESEKLVQKYIKHDYPHIIHKNIVVIHKEQYINVFC